jgi:predicted metal-binding membrane protein
MSRARALAALGLIRPARRRGFCPACRLFLTGDTRREIGTPALTALACLGVAALGWAATIARAGSMDGMAMGLGAFGPFVAGWAVMIVAMMLPSATPLIFEFAEHAERRRHWVAATALLGATYLGVWLAFGVVWYVVFNALGMPWPNQVRIGGAALVVAGVYALTPLKRASEARCRALCALHGPLPFNLLRSAVVAGARYGVSCLGCTAGLMVAMGLIRLSSLAWMIVLTAIVVVYKIAPAPRRWSLPLAAVLVVLGVVYAAVA